MARDAPTFVRRLLGSAEDSIEEWLSAMLGEEVNARIARVPLALGASGVDPFGLDPQWAKYALAAVAFLHRRYFRSEVHGMQDRKSVV